MHTYIIRIYIGTYICVYIHVCTHTIYIHTIYIRTCVVWCDWAVQCVSHDLSHVLWLVSVYHVTCVVFWLVSVYHVACVMCCDWSLCIMWHVWCAVIGRCIWCYMFYVYHATGVMFCDWWMAHFLALTGKHCDTKMVLRNSWNIYITNVMIMLF